MRILDKKLGYHADVVANGKEAVESLERLDYDLVLMDCHMPVMDGYEATGIIRNLNSNVCNHNIPIIAMTANAIKGDRKKCLDAGMDDYISKPINVVKLSNAIDRCLSNIKKTAVTGHRLEETTLKGCCLSWLTTQQLVVTLIPCPSRNDFCFTADRGRYFQVYYCV